MNRKFDGAGYIRYSQAKLSGILFSREFNKRFGKNVRSLSVHPGFVVRLRFSNSFDSKELGRFDRSRADSTSSFCAQASALYEKQAMIKPFLSSFITIDEGAISSLYAATSPEVEEKNLWCVFLLLPSAQSILTLLYAGDLTSFLSPKSSRRRRMATTRSLRRTFGSSARRSSRRRLAGSKAESGWNRRCGWSESECCS